MTHEDIERLTPRDREILDLLAAGKTNKEIERALGMKASAVKRHIESIFHRLRVQNRTEAARRWIERER